jgi:hypothetical protein
MKAPGAKGWKLRTSFGEEVVVVRARDVRKEDDARRMPSLFIRFELRHWLLGPSGLDLASVMDMYRELRAEPMTPGLGRSAPGELARHVLPVLEDAFARGRLVALKVPPAAVRIGLGPPRAKATDDEPEVAGWVEIIVTDDAREPYVGRYRLDLPDGRALSGQFDRDGSVRADGIPGGSCAVAFPELHVRLARGM